MRAKEIQCIQLANALRIKYFREQLEIRRHEKVSVLGMWVMPHKIEWAPSFADKLLQVVFAPFAYLFLLPVNVAAVHLMKLLERTMLRITLWKTVYKSKYSTAEPLLPEYKTLWCFWQLHGIERRKFTEGYASDLLHQWIVILYGQKTADMLDVKRCRKDMWRRNIKANMPYYKRDDAPHYHFRNPFDCVLEDVSEELPPYQ